MRSIDLRSTAALYHGAPARACIGDTSLCISGMATLTFRSATGAPVSTPIQAGHDLLGTLMTVGAPINYGCMSGSCGVCRVRVVSGAEHLRPDQGAEAFHCREAATRLACQAEAAGTGDIVIEQ